MTLLPLAAQLSAWRLGGTRSKQLMLWTDSHGVPLVPKLRANFSGPGQQLDEVNIIDGTESGATLRDAMAGTSARNINWVLAQSFNGIVIRFLTNDVRDGSSTVTQMRDRLVAAIDAIQAAKPSASITLWCPNPYLTTDVGGFGYIQPINMAQTYSDMVKQAYAQAVALRPTVALMSVRDITGDVALPTSPLMADALHTNSSGQDLECKQFADFHIPRGWPFTGPRPATDVFLNDVVLLLNGNALTDATGRHAIAQAPGNVGLVTASGGWLNFPPEGAGLQVLNNLTDFNFGKNDGTLRTGRLTIEFQVISAPRTQTGQVYFDNGNIALSNSEDPTYEFRASINGSTKPGGSPAITGVLTDLAFCYSEDRWFSYINGDHTNESYDYLDFTTGLNVFIGRAYDAWSAVNFVGRLRARVTRDNRFNGVLKYTPHTGPWPTT